MRNLTRSLAVAGMLLAGTTLLAACADDDSAALTAPTDFTAVYQGGAVKTSWTPGEGDPDMFMVMRVEDTTNTTMMWKVPATQTSYDDSTPEAGKTYMYMVHAMQGENVSEASNKVVVAIPVP